MLVCLVVLVRLLVLCLVKNEVWWLVGRLVGVICCSLILVFCSRCLVRVWVIGRLVSIVICVDWVVVGVVVRVGSGLVSLV